MHVVRPHGWASAKILVSYRIVSWFSAQNEIVFFGVHRSLVSFPFFACALAVRKWLISLR
jgi:hypothetical protein